MANRGCGEEMQFLEEIKKPHITVRLFFKIKDRQRLTLPGITPVPSVRQPAEA
jgi:hypothetical protein